MSTASIFRWALACAMLALASRAVLAADAKLDFSGLSYRSIGPAISAGRTTAAVGSDDDPLFYLAGGADGGVFESRDGGLAWKPIFEGAGCASIGVIAVAPKDSNNIWVGTGEANPRNDVASGDGIWHTTDGGKNWKHLGLLDAGSISSITIDPRDSKRVVVGVLGQVFRDSTTRGVYMTSDGGVHFAHVLYLGPATGVSSIMRLPERPDTLFAGLWQFRRKPWTFSSGGSGGGVFRSDDGGRTWRKLSRNGLPSLTGRIGLAAGIRGRVYAVIESKAGDLWRSLDFGQTWRLMPHSPLVGERPFYFNTIAVDPANPNRLMSAGLQLALSTDGGKTFADVGSNPEGDYHAIWWSADGRRVAVGADYGLMLSPDGGGNWRQPFNLPFAQVYHVSADDLLPNYRVCAGFQDVNLFCGFANSDSGMGVLNRDWWTVGSGDGFWALADPQDPDLVWTTTTNDDNGQVYIYNAKTHQASEVSPQSSLNWIPAHLLQYRFGWDTPLTFATDGSALAGGNVVFESADRGQHWTIVSPDLTRNDRRLEQTPGGLITADVSGAEAYGALFSLAVSPRAAATWWAGSDDGLIHVTRDAGVNWLDVTPPRAPHWGVVTCIEPGRFDGATAYAVFDDHMLGDNRPYVFETSDNGAHWRSVAGDLPQTLFVRVIRQDPVDPSLLYAGTQRGVWASWDGGQHWRSMRLNMPASAVYDLFIQTQRDDLLVGTHGRGVWIFDDLTPLQNVPSTRGAALSLFAPRIAYRWWQWEPFQNGGGAAPDNVFAGPNVPYGALINYWIAPGTTEKVSIEILDANRRVVRHFDGPAAAGFNRAVWDFTTDPPQKWLGTFASNQGPSKGPLVVPGNFTVRLQFEGRAYERPLTILPDPRASLSLDQMKLGYQTLRALFGELSDVDGMLNVIGDRLRAHPEAGLRRSLLALRARLSSDPKNVEDLTVTTALRDDLLDLIDRMSGTSQEAPTPSQLATASELHATYSSLLKAYHSLLP